MNNPPRQQLPDAVRDLFLMLRVIPMDPQRRPSAHENLVDVLEICAVAVGRKPVHLHGHGMCDPSAFEALENAAGRFGLVAKRTGFIDAKITSSEERRLGPTVQQALLGMGAAERPAHQVLWLCGSGTEERSIAQVLSGDKNALKQLLGYPGCCVDYHEAEYLKFKVAYLRGLQLQYGASAPEDVARLIANNVPVKTQFHPFSPARSMFPYVSHTPCPNCVRVGPPSPTGKLNQSMRELAFLLDRDFGRSVWESAREEDRTQRVMLREPTSNGPCPCGSGKKMKACCERQ